ncbi:hypothetical protein N7462_010282 [Penicillium macrosclerotiorum]|uniref:uncharacterized protein n=1 Tax=Penicillium macrosclerotiorum TaxID=303699 RepID=UPI0025495612|nr:uncharacterized protein N7462_010282 [Penicillium macrosclerotiorum]KAJ5669212.1 hypothetical protein N7462_010282 [Penicillium macrosclerotiorum]
MSYLFPTAEFAEDQPQARTILATHVLSRGFQLGSAIGLLNSGAAVLLRRRSLTAPVLLRSTGTGAIIGTGIAGVGLVARMWGREEIEWQDRSWRLRYNSGQVAVDKWSEPFAAIGAFAVAARGASGSLMGGWRGLVGGAGVGSLAGIVGCMIVTQISPSPAS